MSNLRRARIVSAINRELMQYLHRLDDERLRDITITHIELSKDLRYAKIYFTTLGKEDERQEVLDALAKASKRIQKDVSHRLKNMRYVPLLSFYYDLSLQKGERVMKLLDEVEKEIEEKEKDEKE
jgi:ribosome-binding factor A